MKRKIRWMTLAVCLWLGVFPLLQFGTYATLTRDKRTWMLILCGVTLVCFLADAFRGLLRRPRLLPLAMGGALLGWMTLSALLSPFPAGVWWTGASVRSEGLMTQLCYLFLFFVCCFSPVSPRPVLVASAGGAAAFLAVVLLQRAGHNPLGLYPAGRSFAGNPEFQGTIGNIDMCTGYLSLLSGLYVSVWVDFLPRLRGGLRPEDRSRVLPAAAALAGLGICVYLILTMEVQFGLIALAAVLCAAGFLLLPRRARLPAAFAAAALLILAVCFWPASSGGIWELRESLLGRPQLSFGSNRLGVWYYSLLLAGERLLTGGGPDTFEPRFNAFLADRGLSLPTSQGGVLLPAYFDNPHNEYIAHLVNGGLPAMLLFAALILAALLLARGQKNSAARFFPFAVLAYAVQAFFSFSVCILAPLFWVCLGCSFAAFSSPESGALAGGPSPARRPASAGRG